MYDVEIDEATFTITCGTSVNFYLLNKKHPTLGLKGAFKVCSFLTEGEQLVQSV